MRCSEKYFLVDRKEIAFLKFVLEAYEGVAILSSISPMEGLVRIHIAPGFEPTVREILEDATQTMKIKPARPPAPEFGEMPGRQDEAMKDKA